MADIRNHGFSEHDRLYEEGIERIRPHIDVNERSPRAATQEARQALEEGVDRLKEAILFNPDNWSAHWFAGKAMEALGKPQQAYEHHKRAYDIMPDHADVARQLAATCLTLDRTKEAVSVAWHATEVKPDDANLLCEFAAALLMDGQVEQAHAIASRALSMAPDDEKIRSMMETIQDVKSGKRPAQAAIRR